MLASKIVFGGETARVRLAEGGVEVLRADAIEIEESSHVSFEDDVLVVELRWDRDVEVVEVGGRRVLRTKRKE